MSKRNIGMWLYQNSGGEQIQKKMKVMRRVKEGENNSKSLNHQNLQVEMAVKTNRL
jgi:hypothetical protein